MSIRSGVLAGLAAAIVIAGAARAEPVTVPLYAGPAPGSEHATQVETSRPTSGGRILRNITQPTLTVYAPASGAANGVGVIVIPGGGFHILSIDNEGTKVAEWLSARGVTAFVLKYRLNETSPIDALAVAQMMKFLATGPASPGGLIPVTVGETEGNADAARAVTLVRSRAAEWGVDPHRVGVVGFSAGAMLTLGLATSPDPSVRPDFAAPIYGLLRPGLAPAPDAPPIFVAAATDDALLPGRSIPIYQAWVAAHRPAELHLYDKGGHGFGMEHQGDTSDHWIEDFGHWLVEHGWMAQPPGK